MKNYENIMMNKIIKLFSNLGYINEENNKIIIFGLQRIRNLIEDILIAMLCGIIMKNLMVGVLFEFSYIPLRIYAGGYHVSSERICKYLSWGSIVVSMIIIFYFPIPVMFQHFLISIALFGISIVSPIESVNKPLNAKEKNIFHRRSVEVAIGEGILYFFLFSSKLFLFSKTICITVVLVAVGLVMEIGQKMLRK